MKLKAVGKKAIKIKNKGARRRMRRLDRNAVVKSRSGRVVMHRVGFHADATGCRGVCDKRSGSSEYSFSDNGQLFRSGGFGA